MYNMFFVYPFPQSFKPYKGKSKWEKKNIEMWKIRVSNPIRESQNYDPYKYVLDEFTSFKPYKGKSKSLIAKNQDVLKEFQTL